MAWPPVHDFLFEYLFNPVYRKEALSFADLTFVNKDTVCMWWGSGGNSHSLGMFMLKDFSICRAVNAAY